jgi:hypothetical protein
MWLNVAEGIVRLVKLGKKIAPSLILQKSEKSTAIYPQLSLRENELT